MPVIMSVGAHHDDNELVGGTLWRHRLAGWQVVLVVLTDGVYAQGQISRDNIAIRDAESRAAAQLLDAEYVCLHLSEGTIDAPRAEAALIRCIRQYTPEVVITHNPDDYHRDHVQTSLCTLAARSSCCSATVAPDVPTCAMPRLYYADGWFVPFQPDQYVDITQVMDQKRQLLQCHVSQLPESSGSARDDMVFLAELQNRRRGIEAGVEYAEAFRYVPALGKQRVTRLL